MEETSHQWHASPSHMNTSQVMSHSNFKIVRNSFYCLHVLAEFVKCVVAFHSHILPKLKIKIFDCEPYCLVYDVKQTKSEKKKVPGWNWTNQTGGYDPDKWPSGPCALCSEVTKYTHCKYKEIDIDSYTNSKGRGM